MPSRAPTTYASFRHTLRHVGPKADIWPDTPATQYDLLNREDMVARPLPSSAAPNSPDLVNGSWIGRLGDAGEITLVVPNAVASDGQPWRSRFDPTGHLQWIEVWSDGELDAVGVIDEPGPDQQQVQVHCYDGFWLLKKAYERDWICTEAPSTVMRRGCSVWVPLVADNFTDPSLPGWTLDFSHAIGSPPATDISQSVGGGMLLALAANQTATFGYVTATGPAETLPIASPVWRSMVTVPANTLANAINGALNPIGRLRLLITESNGDVYGLTLSSKLGQGMAGSLLSTQLTFQSADGPGGYGVQHATIPTATSYTLQLESDGLWVWAFVNGQLVACVRRNLASAYPTTLQTQLALIVGGTFSNNAFSATVGQVVTETMCPFLRSASDPGDYVLPGDATTFPWGGLTARYFNDLDLANDSDRLVKVLNPTRTQSYGASSSAEYQDQVDSVINNQDNPSPGADNVNWSVIWFGSIYLKMSAGNYTFEIVDTTGQGCRVWIGSTDPADILLNQWAFGTAGTQTFTVTQAHLTGTLPYGQGTVVRDGWYPIRIEFRTDGNSGNAPKFAFTNIPTTYTDPGNTVLTGGAGTTVVPATSLSPLGCVDNRYQGVAHYDLVQQVSQAFGYQFSVEPKQLEAQDATSGDPLFPGVCAPRVQEGTLTDVVLEADNGPRQDGEGILNYSTSLQTQDFAASMWGNGAGIQSGNGGQLQGVVFNPGVMLDSLFDVQGWTDFSDAAFGELLQALLGTALSEQDSPWEIVAADPIGRPRFANSWPLPSALLPFRWRPGDGLMLRAPVINLWDVAPRQMLVFQRNFTPEGITSSTATFAERPKGIAYALVKQLYKIRRWQRNYQHQLVTLTGGTSETGTLAAGATDGTGTTGLGSSHVALLPGDTLVALTVRVLYNSNNQQYGFTINGTDVTLDLPAGPWNGVPCNIDLTPIWSQVSSSVGARVQIMNKGGSSSSYNYQVLADVLR